MKLIARFACLSYSKRRLELKDDEDDVEVEDDDDDDEERDEDVDRALTHFVKKGKAKKSKRPGRKPRWCPKVLDDSIDVVNSNEYKIKLIFTNTKNQRNSPIYANLAHLNGKIHQCKNKKQEKSHLKALCRANLFCEGKGFFFQTSDFHPFFDEND